jgi:ADP-ribosylglycohydrolase
MSETTPRERLIGGLVGLVIGDALGVPVEFTDRDSRDLDPVTGMRGFGTWNQPAGTWSDDSSLALASADRLTSFSWDPASILDGYCAWLYESWWTPHGFVFDVGNATSHAIMLRRAGRPWQECGGTGENSNGNGSLMRLLPFSAWLFNQPTEDIVRLAGEASALTHAHLRSRLCCAFHALVCEDLLAARSVREAATNASARLRRYVPSNELSELHTLFNGSAIDCARDAVPSDGYVVSTLAASLWCLTKHDDFSCAVLEAVNLGGDTDTTGAVVGGLAGIRSGINGIPPAWISAIARKDDILDLGERFADACQKNWQSQAMDQP